jgi:integrase
MTKLTEIKIRSLKAGETRREVPDGGGLYAVIETSGTKSFALRFRRAGKPARLVLGSFWSGDVQAAPEPALGVPMTLRGARVLAGKLKLEIAKGVDPTPVKHQTETAETFKMVCDEYVKREGSKLRSAHALDLTLKRAILPTLRDVPVTEIKKSHVVKLLDEIADTAGPVASDRALALIRRILNWYELRADDYRSPIPRGLARTSQSSRARSRILSDDEIRLLWKATETNDPFHALVRFLLLSGARRTEASAMKWSELNGTDWVLPEERNKVGRELTRPLSSAAMAILDQMPRIAGCDHIFTCTGNGPLVAYSKFKARLDAKIGDIPQWQLHDLRRTARSLMSRAGVSSDTGERCLGHIIGGVRGVYDRHTYHSEMQHAFAALASIVAQIVGEPTDSNIVQLRKAAE